MYRNRCESCRALVYVGPSWNAGQRALDSHRCSDQRLDAIESRYLAHYDRVRYFKPTEGERIHDGFALLAMAGDI